jgi:F420H(2)-dependent quinone reductase
MQMTAPSTPARTGPPPAVRAVLRRANRGVKVVLRSRAHRLMSRRFLIVTYAGASSGRLYSTPVMYLESGGALLVAGGAPWWRNIRHGSLVSVRLRGVERRAEVEVVAEPDDLATTLQTIVPRNRVLSRFMRLEARPDGTVRAEDVERARARGLTVARLHLVTEDGR